MTNFKKDSFFLVLLFLIVCIPLFALRGYFGDVIIDGGRELYLPQAILNGEVLFKDIFGLYNPLGYQINALLYMLFGSSITTLQCAGILNAYFLLFAVYYISRCFLNSFLSFSICTIIFCYYIFYSSKCVNYILPYSFCMIYATTFFAVAVLFFTLYMKSDSIKFLYLSYLSLGLSLACKPEFTLCILPLFIIQLLKKENVKTFIFGILCYIAPIILSYSILFLQGFQWSDLSSYMIFIKKFFNTAQQMHYNNTIIEHWSIHSIEQQLFSFAFAFAIIFLGNISYDKLQGLKKEIKTIKELKGTSKEVYTKYLFFGLSLLSIFVVLYSISFFIATYSINIFSWASVALMIIIGINIKDYKNNYLIIGLALIACLSTVRCNFLLSNIYSYSRFLIIIPLTVILIYLFRKVIKIKQIRLYTACILIIFSIFIATIRWQIFFAKIYIPLHTQNLGTLYEEFNKAVAIDTLTDWINKNTNISDTVLIVPEGIYFNFITGRKTNLKYYHLIPNHIAALGEKNIINDLQQNKPDYFILNLQEYSEYGEDVICVNFGQGICKFVRANYNLKENIASADNELIFTIYSLKDTNKKSK